MTISYPISSTATASRVAKRAMLWISVLFFLVPAVPGRAGEVGFAEDFALAENREQALAQLIPGSREYYYYHCLHHQNQGKLDEVDRLLPLWIKRHKRTARVEEIENRQALLKYSLDHRASLDFLRNRLGLKFNHEREIVGAERKLPSELDRSLITRAALTRRALQKHGTTLNGFEDRALDWVLDLELDPARLRHLIARVSRPDSERLARLVVADLTNKHSRGFGSMSIHQHLLLPQLEECARLKPDLLNDSNFVKAYLTKLWPGADDDWRHDAAARQTYLDRLWRFAARLAPAHNSLKVHVLYHRLVHDRAQGVYDKGRFTTYLRLPRNAPNVSREYMKRSEHRRYAANLGANYQSQTLFPVVRDDEPLVRSYLAHFFRSEASYSPYAPYLEGQYLKERFAETKILAGIGDMEAWYSLLPPARLQALRERVDLDFAYDNDQIFAPGEQIGLDLWIKNVRTLIVKVFEINTFNYYRANGRELDTAIDLDGLVASIEKTHTYDEPALRRAQRHFEFPGLPDRGTFVIEFIGNGRSSRALIRRGKLRFLTRTSTAGHVFSVLDEKNRRIADARLWLGGSEYSPEEDGTITVPFSNQPGERAVILVRDGFASLDTFAHEAESYALSAGIHVDREALIGGQKASVIVRPVLTVNGAPVTPTVLEDVRLRITSTDHDGVRTTREIPDFKLFDDRESTQEFQVPARLSAVQFELTAKVEVLSRGEKQDLVVSKGFGLNGIEKTDKIDDLFLGRPDGEYVLDLFGKTGEIKPHRPVQLTLKHRDFRDPVIVSMQTDEDGRIVLGELSDIEWVVAQGPSGAAHQWPLTHDSHSLSSRLHGRVGEVLLLPYMGRDAEPSRAEFSLLERRGSTFVRDRFEALSIRDGFLRLRGLPAGDYELRFKRPGAFVTVRVTEGEVAGGYIVSDFRQLEVARLAPLQIRSVEVTEDAVVVHLANATKFCRVHVSASRFVPEYSLPEDIGSVPYSTPNVILLSPPEALFVSGRDIGDEYRYILERKLAKRFPGNMLERPGMLLNPWAVRSTETGRQQARSGEAFGRKAPGADREEAESAAEDADRMGGGVGGFSSLDFLGLASTVVTNLAPNEDGVVRIPRAALRRGQELHIVAVDPESTVYRRATLPPASPEFADLRLRSGLDSTEHYTEQQRVTVVEKDARFVLGDVTTSEFEVYDSLERIHALYSTLSSDATLAEFEFVVRWPKLKPEEKRQSYSKYACHELDFFLYRKDPEFFRAVVRPYLENKYDKTFLDHWLLGSPLEEYLEPWAYSQLNIVERILLAQRIRDERPHAIRHVEDLLELIAPDLDQLEMLFQTALGTTALEAGADFGIVETRKRLEAKTKDASLRRLGGLERGRARGGRASTSAKRGIELQEKAPAARPQRAAPEAEALRDLRLAGKKRAAEVDARYYKADAKQRLAVRQLFRQLDKTKEWAENNYYHLPIERQNGELITVSSFWRDFASHDGKSPFLSRHVAEASRSFAEMMLALAVLDLPFEADEHETNVLESRFELAAKSPLVVFHKEIRQAEPAEEGASILVSQNFYHHGDRYRHVGNERFDKYVRDEFVVHTVYGCHVVVTNPTSARQKLSVLLQIPRGAIPVGNGRYTRSVNVVLEPYRTWTFEHLFYFPAAGDYPQYPVHVAKTERFVAAAEPFTLAVVENPSKVDRESWAWISQRGSDEELLAFLQRKNLGRVKLERIAWRLRDAELFGKVVELLARRHVYDHTLWSYGIQHDVASVVREYLRHADNFVGRVGRAIDSELLVLDPVERRSYQHLEYRPLVNARAHRLGSAQQIVNDRFFQQYSRLLDVLSYSPALSDDELLSVTYYMLLQDRVEEALAFFGRVRSRSLAAQVQYDYLSTYLAFYTENLARARTLTDKYKEYPVDRWRQLFASATAQLDEIDGEATTIVDDDDRSQQQARLAATEPVVDFEIRNRKILLRHENVSRCRVNYYRMDIELLFSRNPFVQQYSGPFAFIRPNLTTVVGLETESGEREVDIPEEFRRANVLVEVVGGGARKSRAHFANALTLDLVESYSQLRVKDESSGAPLARTYVKVFARMKDGRVRFYKDGYTDLRGRFDYGSLSTNEIAAVERFSILVLSDSHGAMVREAAPPQM